MSIPAPVSGLVLNRSLVDPIPTGAEVLTNLIPTQRGARVRGGLQRVANVGASVTSVFAYNSGASDKAFAATETAVFDISGLDPVNVPSAAISGQTAGYYSTAQIGTVGGEYLYIVNGSDDAQLFDGSSWTTINAGSTPSITGVSTSDLSQVWLYRNRLFFIEKDTLSAWYLPVDSVGGAALEVSLAGVFQRGGSLFLGATWSLDSGDGQDDRCVFVSTEGEIAVYEGSNPASASEWSIVGRYDVAKPLGINGTMRAGGDLVIATEDGIVPLSQVIQKDPAALSLAAVTRPIETLWQREVARNEGSVEIHKWAKNGIAVIVLPVSSDTLVVNLQTGAWGIQSGWTVKCAALAFDRLLAGFDDGFIRALDETGADDGAAYVAQYCHSFAGDAIRYKQAQMVRFTFFAQSEFTLKAGVNFDYKTEFPSAPSSISAPMSTEFLVWDVGNWDEKLWWSPGEDASRNTITTQWLPVSGAGYVLAPTLQITSGIEAKPNIELVRTDVLFEQGEAVV